MYQSINDLPIDYDFNSKTTAELKLYKEWFEKNKLTRLEQLINEVKSDEEFKNWKADYSPESLKLLGSWLVKNVKTEKLSPEKYKEKRARVPAYISINDWELTTDTYSKLVDAGIYFGEVFIHVYKNLKWEQFFSKIKNHADHGHMVIRGFGKKDILNPIRIMSVLSTAIADRTQDEKRIFELFTVWGKYLPADNT